MIKAFVKAKRTVVLMSIQGGINTVLAIRQNANSQAKNPIFLV